MKILITGSRGQLGTELCHILKMRKAEIGTIPEVYNDAQVFAVDSDELDITNEAQVESYFGQNKFDLIINCAAMTNVDACEDQKEKAFEVNSQGPRLLALQASNQDAKFVQLSTDYIFSGTTNKSYEENDRPEPSSVYGHSKLKGEVAVSSNTKKHFIIRTAWLYGYQGNNFVKTITKQAKINGSIKVVDDQFGNPTSANDLGYEILNIAVTENYGIYHCTNKGICSWFDFASFIVDYLEIECEKMPCSTNEFSRAAKRPQFSSLRNKHLEETIGDNMRTWQTAISSYLDNFEGREGSEL